MNSKPQKKPGRPPKNPASKSKKPNVTLRPCLIKEAEMWAEKRGIAVSEYYAIALIKQVARDEESLNQ